MWDEGAAISLSGIFEGRETGFPSFPSFQQHQEEISRSSFLWIGRYCGDGQQLRLADTARVRLRVTDGESNTIFTVYGSKEESYDCAGRDKKKNKTNSIEPVVDITGKQASRRI